VRAAVSRTISLLLGLLAAGCVSAPQPVPEIRPGLLAGYLGKDLPDSLALLPAPPAATSAAFKQDEEISRGAQTLRGTPRYTLATSDADLSFPQAAGVFACALGIPITERGSPRLYLLLRRVLTDAGLATYGAKNKYNRVRPFVHFNEHTCEPKDEEFLRKDGSYPSGHSAIGWAWALVLTEIAPERKDALLARGRSYGESRLVCNVHWQSDVIEGRAVGAAAVAVLHANPTFKADVDAAKREIEALRAKGEKPGGDCPSEAATLAIRIPGVL
jgi:acid phosphatase (class A)